MTSEQAEALLRVLCVDLGFCLSPDSYAALVDAPPDTPEGFARAVYVAEGLDYDTDPRIALRLAIDERVRLAMDGDPATGSPQKPARLGWPGRSGLRRTGGGPGSAQD